MRSLAEMTDEELMRRMWAGEREAFAELYRRRQPAIYRFALHMSGSEAVAEDAVQEVFLMLIRGAGKYDAGKGTLEAWLYGAARNQVLRGIQHQSRTVEVDEECLACEPAVMGALARGESIAAVRQAVLALPPHYREAVVLCDLHEMSYEEAAAVSGCPVGTIRSRLSRARKLLCGKLAARSPAALQERS